MVGNPDCIEPLVSNSWRPMEKLEANCISNEHSASSAKNTVDEGEVLKDDFYSNDRLHCGEVCLHFHDQDYIEKMKEFHFYLDTVRRLAKPGCSQEVLNVALTSLSTIVQRLYVMSSRTHPHASL